MTDLCRVHGVIHQPREQAVRCLATSGPLPTGFASLNGSSSRCPLMTFHPHGLCLPHDEEAFAQLRPADIPAGGDDPWAGRDPNAPEPPLATGGYVKAGRIVRVGDDSPKHIISLPDRFTVKLPFAVASVAESTEDRAKRIDRRLNDPVLLADAYNVVAAQHVGTFAWQGDMLQLALVGALGQLTTQNALRGAARLVALALAAFDDINGPVTEPSGWQSLCCRRQVNPDPGAATEL